MKTLPFITLLIFLIACKTADKKDPSSAITKAVAMDNILTAKEKADGWKLLFDGSSLDQWHMFKGGKASDGWQIKDNAIYHDPGAGSEHDLITNEEFEDFEFSLDWKIEDCGNSGIFWNIQENEKFSRVWHTAPELQVLDNKCHPDAKIVTHRAGDLYDMIETSVVNVKPAGEWNSVTIKSKDAAMEFWQNGAKVVEFTMHSTEWDAMVADSKFKDMADFGKYRKGKIGLQDHRNHVWFKNIKIRSL